MNELPTLPEPSEILDRIANIKRNNLHMKIMAKECFEKRSKYNAELGPVDCTLLEHYLKRIDQFAFHFTEAYRQLLDMPADDENRRQRWLRAMFHNQQAEAINEDIQGLQVVIELMSSDMEELAERYKARNTTAAEQLTVAQAKTKRLEDLTDFLEQINAEGRKKLSQPGGNPPTTSR